MILGGFTFVILSWFLLLSFSLQVRLRRCNAMRVRDHQSHHLHNKTLTGTPPPQPAL
ncbi:hypothetical protein DM02DRAFT_618917, partial [Periconia macrospinosa]